MINNINEITFHSILGPDECLVQVNMKYATEKRIKTLKKFYPGAILITNTNFDSELTLLDYFHSCKSKSLKKILKNEYLKNIISSIDMTLFESKSFNFNRKSFSNLYESQRKTLEKNLNTFPETIKILKYNPSVEIISNFNDSFDFHKSKSKVNVTQIYSEVLNNSYFDINERIEELKNEY